MKKIFLLFCLVWFVQANAQVSKPLQFKEESFDFGQIKESAGPVVHQFEFTNLSNRPIKIIGVKPSCGCTTPDWTKEPIMPGKTGFIQAQFDPKGRPGYFVKTLAVTTDAEGGAITLQIKGTVNTGTATDAAEFSGTMGNWKVKSNSFNLGKVFLKDEFVTNNFDIVNGGSKVVNYLGKYDGPAYVRVSVEPKSLAPGERGIVKLSYNGKLKNKYGFQTDNIVIHTDDEQQPMKSFTVYATLEDYFPELTPAEKAKAPRLKMSASSMDFGRLSKNQTVTKDFVVTNTGKSVLELRSVQGNCSCISTAANSKSIKPGESTLVKISFNPQDRSGTQQKAVTIYSNDPQNPVQRITFTAYVEE